MRVGGQQAISSVGFIPMRSPPALTPCCPRCGYDQSGPVATWTVECPLSGQCVECGHCFAWADLFDPMRQDLPWHVEHAASLVAVAVRTPGTAWRMVWPPVFWRRAGVHTRVSVRRLVEAVILGAVLSSLLAVLPLAFVWGLGRTRVGWATLSVGNYFDTFDLGDLTRDVSSALLLPYAFVDPVFGPLGISWHSGEQVLRDHAWWGLSIGTGLTWMLVMGVLPVTRRLARLRLAHLMRAWIAGLIPLALLWGLWRFGLTVDYVVRPRFPVLPIAPLITVLAMIWTLVWWGAAVRAGWGVRSITLIVLVSFAAILGGFHMASLIERLSGHG